MGATDLLVRIWHRDLFRVRHLQLEAESEENCWRNRVVARAENRRSNLDCIRIARLDLVVGTLSHRTDSGTAGHRHRASGIRTSVEPGRATKLSCSSFRSYTCPASDDGNTRREHEIVAAAFGGGDASA